MSCFKKMFFKSLDKFAKMWQNKFNILKPLTRTKRQNDFTESRGRWDPDKQLPVKSTAEGRAESLSRF